MVFDTPVDVILTTYGLLISLHQSTLKTFEKNTVNLMSLKLDEFLKLLMKQKHGKKRF